MNALPNCKLDADSDTDAEPGGMMVFIFIPLL
jgi:hypothetical protein